MTIVFFSAPLFDRITLNPSKEKSMPVYDRGYAHPELLITVDELAEHLQDPNWLVIDARPGDQYDSGHIPGATNVDVFAMHWNDTSPQGIECFIQLNEEVLGEAGVRPNAFVVCYDEISGIHAARCFWLLEWLGHPQVAVLDGGLKAWTSAGYDLEYSYPDIQPSKFKAHPLPDRLATFQYILDRLNTPGVCILDTRSDAEHYGRQVRARRGGCIPKSKHLEWVHNLTLEGTYKKAEDLRELYQKTGVTPDQEIITYCQGGYRSAHSYLALRLIGYEKVRNYLGSWGEWGNRMDLPVEIPPLPEKREAKE